MKVIKSVSEMKEYIKTQSGKKIGLVPTMGYLHEGHASLIKRCSDENEITVVSVFVNPTQFGVGEDLDKYPRDLEHDCTVAKNANADIIFNPSAEEMYQGGYATYVSLRGEITSKLCGVTRPTHFTGVATVVLKLFNIVKPQNSYFGQKDAQQLAVIKQMVKDLNLDVKINPCPIIREESGLAKSSRNTYLSQQEKDQAIALYGSLCMAKDEIEGGQNNTEIIKDKITKYINEHAPLSIIDYIEIVDCDTMAKVDKVGSGTLIALAVKFPSARLIDNIII